MREDLIRELYGRRGLGSEAADHAVRAVRAFEDRMTESGGAIETASEEDLRRYLEELVRNGGNSRDRLLALARYFHLIRRDELYLYAASLLGLTDIYGRIRDRAGTLTNGGTGAALLDGLAMPPLGAPPEAFPAVTRLLMERLRASMPGETRRKVLAGNHHGIPLEGFAEDPKRLAAMGLEAYLADLHARAVAELRRHQADGTLWYEQRITARVVEFVESEQEVLSGVRRGDRILVTKIPFAPDEWLRERDPLRKRWLACHCPLARSSILQGGDGVPAEWCYCSAGYEKLRFDVAFGTDLEAEVLESALGGSGRCRFALKLPEGFAP